MFSDFNRTKVHLLAKANRFLTSLESLWYNLSQNLSLWQKQGCLPTNCVLLYKLEQ